MRHLITGLAIGALLSGCATTDGAQPGAPRSEVDKAIGACIATAVVTTALGAIIGNNSRGGSAGGGAAVGAAFGAGACAVMLAVASQKDKEQIAQAQRQAAEAGASREVSYVGDDGRGRKIAVAAETVADPTTPVTVAGTTTPPRICRKLHTTIAVDGVGSTSLPTEYTCRMPDGNWITVRPTGPAAQA